MLQRSVSRFHRGTAFGLAAAASIALAGTALAQPTDYGACVAKNKKFGGATAACASETCTWEVCKDRVIYRTGTTSRSTDAPLSYQKDPGAWSAALAVCIPDKKIMDRCMHREVKATARPSQENKKKRPPFCRTGYDIDLGMIKLKVSAMANTLKSYKRAMKPLDKQRKSHRAAIKAATKFIKPERARFRADKARAKGNKDYRKTYNAKWISSGRLNRLNDVINARNEQALYFKKVLADLEPLEAKFQALGKRYKFIAHELLDTKRDCAAAKAALR